MLLDMLRALVVAGDDVTCDDRDGLRDRADPGLLGAAALAVRFVSVSCRGWSGEEDGLEFWEVRSRRRGCESWSNRDSDIDIPVERLTDPRLEEAPEDDA